MSKMFAQVMAELSVKHQIFSAYHPESQGALERFHQTLKSMVCKYCMESNKDWEEGLPLLLAIRETTQESLGFSPAELVRLLQEKLIAEKPDPTHSVLDYVGSFRERLHTVCKLARSSLSTAQSEIKQRYDRKTLGRSLRTGDQVMVLLPVVGSCLQAKFSGPYECERQLSATDYVVRMPDRKKKSRVVTVVSPPHSSEGNGLGEPLVPVQSPRLRNTEILGRLESHLSYLSEPVKSDICPCPCVTIC